MPEKSWLVLGQQIDELNPFVQNFGVLKQRRTRLELVLQAGKEVFPDFIEVRQCRKAVAYPAGFAIGLQRFESRLAIVVPSLSQHTTDGRNDLSELPRLFGTGDLVSAV